MTEFKIGDKLFHPVHGTGTLADLDKETKNGEVTDYLVISLTESNGILMTPVERAEEIGLRRVVKKGNRPALWKLFAGRPRKMSKNYRKRSAQVQERLVEGGFKEIAHLIRDLAWREVQSGFNSYDRRIFKRAKGLLAQELAVSEGIETDEAKERMESALERRLSRWQE
ncbi:MAG: CarD family transcriptional regulator [Anaerolineae bacterium]